MKRVSFAEHLPIHDVLPELLRALATRPLTVAQAPPGAGKSTVVPLEVLSEDWLAGQRVIVLQPRRVAARAVAFRMAELLGEDVGQTVGYRVRFESRVSRTTRVEVVTEGILTRMLQRDPGLDGVGLIVFDEFHERSLQADLALALAREVQSALRDDLRILVMSATLAGDVIDALGPAVPVVKSAGRQFPVEVRYASDDPAGPPGALVAGAVGRALHEHDGDVLAFLPGTGEIRDALDRLDDLPEDVIALPLFGDLPVGEQRRALLPDPQGRRKVVLATSIAETSLTLEGVRVVVDSGLARVSRFDPRVGLTRLVTERVTRDAADQRAGRAGRVAPGVCYRLWSERTHALLRARRTPEILEADLAPLVLEVAQWGARDVRDLAWLDAPPDRAVMDATRLLERLGALREGRATERGSRMLALPTHPRLAHLLLDGADAGLAGLACDVAALLEERDPLGREDGIDLAERVVALRAHRTGRASRGDRGVLSRVEQLARQWRRLLGAQPENGDVHDAQIGNLVALAYPERVARRRDASRTRYKLASGRGVRLPDDDGLAGSEFLAVAHVDAGTDEGRVFLGARIDREALERMSTWTNVVRWDARAGVLVAQREQRVGTVTLDAKPLADVPAAERADALASAVRSEGLGALQWSREARQWQARVLSLRAWRPGEDWPDVRDEALLASVEEWLIPHLQRVRSRDDLARVNVAPLLAGLLPWPLAGRLDALAPESLAVPSGHHVRLEYSPDGSPPVLAVKLQEMFGLADTPTVNDGRTRVLLHLLSPARRPVQVTQDLRSFWERTYAQVRKELRSEYPKHPWPEDPWTAIPTRSVKRRDA